MNFSLWTRVSLEQAKHIKIAITLVIANSWKFLDIWCSYSGFDFQYAFDCLPQISSHFLVVLFLRMFIVLSSSGGKMEVSWRMTQEERKRKNFQPLKLPYPFWRTPFKWEYCIFLKTLCLFSINMLVKFSYRFFANSTWVIVKGAKLSLIKIISFGFAPQPTTSLSKMAWKVFHIPMISLLLSSWSFQV